MWTLLDLVNKRNLLVLKHTPGRVRASEGYPGDRHRFVLAVLSPGGGDAAQFTGEQADVLLQAGLSSIALRGASTTMRLRLDDMRGGESVVLSNASAREPVPENPLAGLLDGTSSVEDPFAGLLADEAGHGAAPEVDEDPFAALR